MIFVIYCTYGIFSLATTCFVDSPPPRDLLISNLSKWVKYVNEMKEEEFNVGSF